ncbi:MAG: hypothetical protein QM758_10475 [Armatimonas sp.]
MLFPRAALLAPIVCLLLLGCGKPEPHVLGKELPAAPPISVATLKTATVPVSLAGTIVEKCPTAGCWFRLKDSTGIVKIQLANAGFTVTDVPQGSPVTVFGSYDKESGEVEATGVRW